MKKFKKNQEVVVKYLDGEKFEFAKSKLLDKKYSVIVNGKVVHFGSSYNGQYHDKIGMFSHLDHNNSTKRRMFKARMSKIMTNCKPTYKIKYSPLWFSWHFLW